MSAPSPSTSTSSTPTPMPTTMASKIMHSTPRHGASSLALAILVFALLSIASGFSSINRVRHTTHTSFSAHSAEEDDSSPLSADHSDSHPPINRRTWLTSQIIPSSIIIFGSNANANADDGDTNTAASPSQASRIVPKNKSVIVLGANGGTGRECVSAILASGRPCVATTRSGMFNYDDDEMLLGDDKNNSQLRRSNSNLQEGQVDATNLNSILTMVDQIDNKNIGAMIFAASASVKGKTPGVNDAFTVDCQGVINAAQCCIQRNIPRLIIVSSGAVTRPNSAVYKLLNFVGGRIMEAKIQGEDGVRDLYHDNDVVERGLGYTIVRPGGLTADPIPLGPAYLEVNQGDDKSGRLSRADVAGICVACLESESAFDSTFECYESNTAKPVENVGLSNVLRLTDATSYTSGREGRGETWDVLLGGLKSDFD